MELIEKIILICSISIAAIVLVPFLVFLIVKAGTYGFLMAQELKNKKEKNNGKS